MPDAQPQQRRAPQKTPAAEAPKLTTEAQAHELASTFRFVEELSRLQGFVVFKGVEFRVAPDATKVQGSADFYQKVLADFHKHSEKFHKEANEVARRYQEPAAAERMATLGTAFDRVEQQLQKIVTGLGDNPSHAALQEASKKVEALFSLTKNTAAQQLQGLVSGLEPVTVMQRMRAAYASNRNMDGLLKALSTRVGSNFRYDDPQVREPGPGIELSKDQQAELVQTLATMQMAAKMATALDQRTLELSGPRAGWKQGADLMGWQAKNPVEYLKNFASLLNREKIHLQNFAYVSPKGDRTPPALGTQQFLQNVAAEVDKTAAWFQAVSTDVQLRGDIPLRQYTGSFLNGREQAWALYEQSYAKLGTLLGRYGVSFGQRDDKAARITPAGSDLLDALAKGVDPANTQAVKDLQALERYLTSGFPRTHDKWFQVEPPPE